MRRNPNYQSVLMRAGVWRSEHVVHHGRHSNTRLDMTELRHNPMRFNKVMNGINNLLTGAALTIPVGRVSFDLVAQQAAPHPSMVPFELKSGGDIFVDKDKITDAAKNVGSVALFQDIVRSGRSTAEVAQELKAINPDIKIDLISIWSLGEMHPAASGLYASQQYLVQQRIPSVTAEECFNFSCAASQL